MSPPYVMEADIPIPRAHDLTGTVLGGRYEVLGKLGVGGMAAVYEGRRVGLHNRVAIKVLKPELCEDPGNVKRFLREARAASVIEHDNIVDIIDFGPVEGDPVYFVMEFLEGSDLRRVVKQSGALSWPQVKPIFLQVVGALQAAHDKGIVHRDVKPANIFLVPRASGQTMVKVLDFGIAKVVEEGRGGITRGLTMTNGLLGTVAYMAPEQARGQKIDARTDIYALGVVMYQVLTGAVPFTGNNPFMVLERHVNETPRPPRETVPSIPPEVEGIVLRCLAKNADERFQSMNDVAAALRAVPEPIEQTSGPITLESARSDPRAWSPPKEPPVDEHPARVVATERLGSGSGDAAASFAAASMSRRGGTQPTVATPPTLQTTPAPSSSTTDRSPTHQLPPANRIPYKAFFVLGFGLGIVGACAIAFLAITHYEPESRTPAMVFPDEPAQEGAQSAEPPPEPPAPEPAPAPEAEPELEPEPAEPEPEVAETPAPEGDGAAAASEDVTATKDRRQRRRRNNTSSNTSSSSSSHTPSTTPTTRETKSTTRDPDRKPKEPGDDVHPDLRDPYGNKK